MKTISIPGVGDLNLENILLDYNGTLAVDGIPVPGVRERINAAAKDVNFHVITADTFGTVERELEGVNCSLVTIPQKDQDLAKAQYLDKLGAQTTLACGNGANDERMLRNAALGVAVMLEEGLNVRALLAADLLIRNIADLFAYLEKPGRLVACMRK